MSGHPKRVNASTDKKRGNIATKTGKEISVKLHNAPNQDPRIGTAVDKAKSDHMLADDVAALISRYYQCSLKSAKLCPTRSASKSSIF